MSRRTLVVLTSSLGDVEQDPRSSPKLIKHFGLEPTPEPSPRSPSVLAKVRAMFTRQPSPLGKQEPPRERLSFIEISREEALEFRDRVRKSITERD